jgi:ubiquinone/menaquinone biosynthesis C-methylase UbiE
MTREYFNRRAADWDDCAAEKDPAKLERMAQSLDIRPGSIVLDAGTGTGILVPFLLRKIGDEGKLVCLDFAEEMLLRARKKTFAGDISYICSDIVDTRLESQYFDAVVCYSSFPHFRDKPKALKEINRLLKKGGALFICHSSSRESINRIHHHIKVLSQDIIPPQEAMQQLLATAGFKDVDIADTAERYLASARK